MVAAPLWGVKKGWSHANLDRNDAKSQLSSSQLSKDLTMEKGASAPSYA